MVGFCFSMQSGGDAFPGLLLSQEHHGGQCFISFRGNLKNVSVSQRCRGIFHHMAWLKPITGQINMARHRRPSSSNRSRQTSDMSYVPAQMYVTCPCEACACVYTVLYSQDVFFSEQDGYKVD